LSGLWDIICPIQGGKLLSKGSPCKKLREDLNNEYAATL
jgi:hypothetical protein